MSRKPNKYIYNVEGNTVTMFPEAPRRSNPRNGALEKQKELEVKRRRLEKEREAERKRRLNQRIATRNRKKLRKMDLKLTIFFCSVLCVAAVACISNLNIRTKLSQQTNEISTLEKELNTWENANLATSERINSAVDLEKISEVAIEKLGMNYAREDQIIYYRMNTNNYIRQYNYIPK